MESAKSSDQLFGKDLARKLVLPVALAVAAYLALLLYGDAPAVLRSLSRLTVATLMAGLGVSLASLALRAVRWLYYLNVVGLQVPIVDSLMVFTAGLGMSITPGKVGEVLKSLLLKERFDIPVARSGPIIVAERLSDLGGLLLIGGISLGYQRSPYAVAACAALFLAFLFAFGRSQRLGGLAISLFCLVPFIRRFKEKLLAAHAALRQLWGFRSFCVGMLLSILMWGVQALTIQVFAAGLAGVHISIATAVIAFAAPLLAGTLALVPGGLGLTEASMAGTLHVFSGIPTTPAIAVTLLTRAATFWLAVVLGLGSLASWNLLRRAPRPESMTRP